MGILLRNKLIWRVQKFYDADLQGYFLMTMRKRFRERALFLARQNRRVVGRILSFD